MQKIFPFVIGMLGFTLLMSGCNQGAMPDGNPHRADGFYNTRSATDDRNQVRFTGRNNNAVNPGVADRFTDRFIGPNGNQVNHRNANMERVDDNRAPAVKGQPYGLLSLSRAELNQLSNSPVSIDRGRLANAVAQSISSFREISDVTILVTDDHVYIGYNRNGRTGQTDQSLLEKRLRQAAISVVPGYYKVRVSGNRALTDRVLRLLDGERPDVDKDLDRLLENGKERTGS